MDVTEIQRVLQEFYDNELTDGRKRHIVFWYDEAGDFIEDVEAIQLEGVRIWKVTENNLFRTKYELEKQDSHSNFLLYANMPKPLPQNDWLHDQYKLGQEFTTDKITIIMRELNITDDSLKEVFKGYQKFFNNKSRLQAFRKYPIQMYTEETIDITVLAALVKSNTNTIDDVIKTLLRDENNSNGKGWHNIQRFGNEEKFWLLLEKFYGYALPEKDLTSLVTFFMMTYLAKQSDTGVLPEAWQYYVSNQSANVIVLMDQWMNHREERHIFNSWGKKIADNMDVDRYTNDWHIENMKEMDVFPLFDNRVIHFIVNQLTNDVKHFESYKNLIATRRKLHWYPEFEHAYEALRQAIQLIQQLHELDDFIPEETAERMFSTYTESYFRIDTAYRKFYFAFDKMEDKESLHELREMIERSYVQVYQEELAMKWALTREYEANRIWPIAGIEQQQDFYKSYVASHIAQEERIFVIVSDALRYEIAQELTEVLNTQQRASADITAIQGILPSYTEMGMAALLPHKELCFSADGKVMADGIHTSGTGKRQHILQKAEPNALAIQYQDLISMNRSEMRETLSGKRLTYIYHNVIDARGDNAATEMEIFQAAEEALSDIRVLINQLVNNVSASNIIITADHGFLYQRDRIESSQKLPVKPEDTIVMNRRFAVLNQSANVDGTITYPLTDMTIQDEDYFVMVPRGINRFAIQGSGANYVHGGAMLQEIVVPVITYKNERKSTSGNIVNSVDVKLTTPMRKVTNSVIYLEFFQTEKVEDKKRPRQLSLYFTDDSGNRISNENNLIADSSSTQVVARTYKEKFVFQAVKYNKDKTYYLVMEDVVTGLEYDKYTFAVDIV